MKDIIDKHMEVLTEEKMVDNLAKVIKVLTKGAIEPLFMGNSGKLREALLVSNETINEYASAELDNYFNLIRCQRESIDDHKDAGNEYYHLEVALLNKIKAISEFMDKYNAYLKHTLHIQEKLTGIAHNGRVLPQLEY